jgi:nucleoside-diphosphate-sugar epimerase
MRIAITGAAGFIGRALALRLAQQGHDILALDNNYRGNLASIVRHARIARQQLDVVTATDLPEVLRGVDAVYHLAAINGTGNFYEVPDRVLEVGVVGTHNALKAALKSGVGAFYFASSSEVYGHAATIPTPEDVECRITDVFNPRFSYAGSKLIGELLTINYLRNSGLRYGIFRPHNVYGPQMGHEHVIPQIVKRIVDALHAEPGRTQVTIPLQGSGEETRAFMYIDDAVRAIEMATLDRTEDGLIHIGVEDERRIADLALAIGRALDVDVELQRASLREGSPVRRCPNTARLRSLGFRPEVSLEQGIAQTARWYAQHYAERALGSKALLPS